MEKFEVGEKVRFTLLGKGRLSRIVSFVPSIGGDFGYGSSRE